MKKEHIHVGVNVHKETTVIALAHGSRNGNLKRVSESRRTIEKFSGLIHPCWFDPCYTLSPKD